MDFTVELVLPEKDEGILIDWILKTDGASNQKGSTTGFVLESLEGFVYKRTIHLNFLALNNETEYEALIRGMKPQSLQ